MNSSIVETIGTNICFSFPIGWDEIGVIATVLAVIVALFANNGARKQLKSALKMQEQSKNVSLLDQRMNIVETIRQNELPSETSVRILFNEEIVDCFVALAAAHKAHTAATHDENTYFQSTLEKNDIGELVNPVKNQIQEYEYFMKRPDCPQKVHDDYKKYCDNHETWWSETGLSDDRRTYNHAEIRNRMIAADQDIQNNKTKILAMMEDFLSQSIAPVNKK